MITSLSIENFALIEKLSVQFSDGFSTITGETGAGKSILIDALGLLLGGRGDASFVREGASKAELTGIFQATPAASAWLAEREIEMSDQEIKATLEWLVSCNDFPFAVNCTDELRLAIELFSERAGNHKRHK